MPHNGAQNIDPFIATRLSMQADHSALPERDVYPVDKPNPSLVRAQSGATSLFSVSKTDPTLDALRPAAQTLLDAHRPLAFLWQQGLIAIAPLASLLGVDFSRPAPPTQNGAPDALE